MSSRILLFVGKMPKVFFHLFWLSQCCDYMFCCMLNTVSEDSEKDSSSSVVQGVFLLAVAKKNGHEESNARMQIMMAYLKIKSTKNQRRMDPKFWVYIPIPFTRQNHVRVHDPSLLVCVEWNANFPRRKLQCQLVPMFESKHYSSLSLSPYAYIVWILDLHGGTALMIQVVGQTNIALIQQHLVIKVIRGKTERHPATKKTQQEHGRGKEHILYMGVS